MVYKNLIYKNTDNTAYIKHTRICLPMQMRETWVQSLGQENHLEEELATFLPVKSHRQRNLVGYKSSRFQNSWAQFGN